MIDQSIAKVVIAAFFTLAIFTASAQCPTETNFSNGGTFSGPCSVDYGDDATITGHVVITGGTFTISEMWDGGLVIANGASLTIQGGTFTLNDNDFYNDSHIVVQAGGTLTITGGTLNVEEDLDISGTVVIGSGATVNTTNGGDIDVLSGGSLDVQGTLNSDDYINVYSGGTVTVSGDMNSDNDIQIDGGEVTVEDGGTMDSGDDIQVYNSGSLTIDVGGSASTSGGHGDVLNSDDEGTPGNGESQGTITVNGTLDVSNDVVILQTNPGSALSGSGTVTADGSFTDEENGDFSDCGGGGATCGPDEPWICDETTSCTANTCPTEADLENGGGVFCGTCTLDIDGTIDIDEEVCWVSGTLTVIGNDDANFNISDGGHFNVVSGTVDISMNNGDLNVEDGGTLTIQDNATVDVDDYLVVEGVVEMSGDLTTGNDVEVDGGTVAVLDGGNLTSGDDIQVFDGGILVVQEGGTASTSGTHGDVMNSDDDGNPDNNESLGTIVIDGTLNVSNDVEILTSDPESSLNGTGTINVSGDFTDEEGGDFEDCVDGSSCDAEAPIACDETTFCTENDCPVNEDDLEDGGTFCGNCTLDIDNTIDIEADVCWVSGTLTLNGDGGADEFDLEEGVTFTVVSGSVIVSNGDVDILSGADLVILDDGEFVAGDDFNVAEGAGVIVDGVLNVVGDIDIGETVTGAIVVNDGGNVNANSVDGSQPTSAEDLPDNIDLASGGGFNVAGSQLPVVLMSFSGSLYEGHAGLLQWRTASEIDNSGFYIERSTNGTDFETVGFVEGNGTSRQIRDYDFIDYSIEVSSYYRLRQVDYDGGFEFSPMIYLSLINSSTSDPIKIYPNPTRGKVYFDGMLHEVYDVQVVDLSGRMVLEAKKITLLDAGEWINEQLFFKGSGMFFLKFTNPGYGETIRLIKE